MCQRIGPGGPMLVRGAGPVPRRGLLAVGACFLLVSVLLYLRQSLPGRPSLLAVTARSPAARTPPAGHPIWEKLAWVTLPGGRKTCGEDGERGGVDDGLLLIGVSSAIGHYHRREAIRETWASYKPTNIEVKVVFVLGTEPPGPQVSLAKGGVAEGVAAGNKSAGMSLGEEISRHGDILQADFWDTYQNLTLKTLVLARWTLEHCPRTRYLMKTDDDMFVNVPRLAAYIHAGARPSNARVRPVLGTNLSGDGTLYNDRSVQPARTRSSTDVRIIRPETAEETFVRLHPSPGGAELFGCLIEGAVPDEDRGSRHYRTWFEEPTYPRYLSGTGYLMAAPEVVVLLYRAARRIPYFYLEDIFFTGMCAREAGIRPTNHADFDYTPRTGNEGDWWWVATGRDPQDPCRFKDVITAHKVPPDLLRLVWRGLYPYPGAALAGACDPGPFWCGGLLLLCGTLVGLVALTTVRRRHRSSS